jgi:hypothetical protein
MLGGQLEAALPQGLKPVGHFVQAMRGLKLVPFN